MEKIIERVRPTFAANEPQFPSLARSNNPYFKRALIIYLITLAVLGSIKVIRFFEGELPHRIHYYGRGRWIPGMVVIALIPVAFYFVIVWIKNNKVHRFDQDKIDGDD